MLKSTDNDSPIIVPKGIELLSALPNELQQMSIECGFPQYHGTQLFSWIHRKRITQPDGMSNLPARFKELIGALEPIVPVSPGELLTSKDGTRKIGVLLKDGMRVETVLIPEKGKLTQCISSQVGCAVGCLFCRSGSKGLVRNLTAAEILGQIFLARNYLFEGERLSNVVFMGVGEPFHNFANVQRAFRVMSHADGMNLSTRRITLSTVGIVRGIEKLAESENSDISLAVSLHAADDETRSVLVPGVKAGLGDIVAALKAYPLQKRRRFTIEYVMVKGVNDSDQDALNLVRLLSNLRVKVNLLPLNPHDRTHLEPPDEQSIESFQKILSKKGLSVFLRRRRGEDINAACGQLLAID